MLPLLGYICAERLSTFITMVATEQTYEVMFMDLVKHCSSPHLLTVSWPEWAK